MPGDSCRGPECRELSFETGNSGASFKVGTVRGIVRDLGKIDDSTCGRDEAESGSSW